MALTEFQITIIRLLSERRKKEGISYVAGGAALNYILKTNRLSRDIDLFHDTIEAVNKTFQADRQELTDAGFVVQIIREAQSYIEADIKKSDGHVLIQWVRDSAFRFFPMIEDNLLGLTLDPFDLATNKVLALVNRLEPRDWVDAIECNRSVQQLGFLIWAACGKDPGMNPDMMLAEASRIHFAQAEIETLDFGPHHPSAANLSKEWKEAITEAKKIVNILPEDHLGECVLNRTDSTLYRGHSDLLNADLQNGNVEFFKGTIGGVWPQIVK